MLITKNFIISFKYLISCLFIRERLNEVDVLTDNAGKLTAIELSTLVTTRCCKAGDS